MGAPFKTCADCRHFFKGHARAPNLCRGPQRIRRTNRVTGQSIYPANAEYERASLWRALGLNTCGPEARYFEEQIPRNPAQNEG